MPKNSQEIIKKIHMKLPDLKALRDEPMWRHTTFRIGGPADFLIQPKHMEEVAQIISICRENSVPVTIIGNGSNLLVLDKGIRGIVIKIGNTMDSIRKDGLTVTSGAGNLLTKVARFAANNQLTGMEFAIGIPGTVGGALFMNAGAYDGEMSLIVASAMVVLADGSMKRYYREEMDLQYRHSIFQDNGAIICEVELKLAPGDSQAIEEKIKDYTVRRKTKQPLEMPSAGSTFRRPPGYYAGTLIEQTGLKGLTIGGAQVSSKHAGFIVNADCATADDVLRLIAEVVRRVYDQWGVCLHPEVRIIGEK